MAGNLVDLFQPARRGCSAGQPGVRFTGIVRDIVLHRSSEAQEQGLPHDLHRRLRLYKKDPERRKEILYRRLPEDPRRLGWQVPERREDGAYIISRLTPLAKNPRLRTIFGTPGAKLRIADLMDERSIFLVNIGGATEAGIILGTMIPVPKSSRRACAGPNCRATGGRPAPYLHR